MTETSLLTNNPPVILSLSALDPSGRGGIQADIEVAASLCCHCSPVAAALCSSGDSSGAEVLAVDSALLIHQARSLLEDVEVAAIKIGYLGSVANIEAVHAILNDYSNIPVILQPNFCLLDEADSEQMEQIPSLANLLLPYANLVVASLAEARLLSSSNDTPESTAQSLIDEGPDSIFLCTADLKARRYEFKLFNDKGLQKTLPWTEDKHSPNSFGAESTLSAAISTLVAHGSPLDIACERALAFTQNAISNSWQLGFERPTPNRFFWVNESNESSGDCGDTH